MNGATKDELNVASKMMAIGLSVKEAVTEMTLIRRTRSSATTSAICLKARLPTSRFSGWRRASSASPIW